MMYNEKNIIDKKKFKIYNLHKEKQKREKNYD